jgi:saccharopine dehydrogenase-like NADP-dependent oxidoreductase
MSLQDVPILLADIRDQASVDKMVSSTKVVLATAGPFTTLGRPIVDAAVRHGTHYADITGSNPILLPRKVWSFKFGSWNLGVASFTIHLVLVYGC